MTLVSRTRLIKHVSRELERFPVVLLVGPRQCGKTTLAREVARHAHDVKYFDLEDPQCPLVSESAALTLRELKGLVVIDEFQRMPQLFTLLRVLADRRPLPAHFLILGSAAPELVRGVSETLAGRVAYVPMGGFDLAEVGVDKWRDLWVRGRFPDSFLAKTEEDSYTWRQNFIRSFLERDIPQLGIRVPAPTLRRFWTMLAHWHGQTWNASELARALDTRQATVRHYLDILCGSFMIRELSPWFENTAKRVVKAPKVYFRDTGLLHTLLGLCGFEQVMSYPRLGFSWEGFAIEEILRLLDADHEAYFYKTYSGAELDLLVFRGGKRMGFEFKYQDSPRVSKSMYSVMEALRLDRLYVVHPGTQRSVLQENIEAIPLGSVNEKTIGD